MTLPFFVDPEDMDGYTTPLDTQKKLEDKLWQLAIVNPNTVSQLDIDEAIAAISKLIADTVVAELQDFRDHWHNLGFRGEAMEDIENRLIKWKEQI